MFLYATIEKSVSNPTFNQPLWKNNNTFYMLQHQQELNSDKSQVMLSQSYSWHNIYTQFFFLLYNNLNSFLNLLDGTY